jgi:hypothetical protein
LNTSEGQPSGDATDLSAERSGSESARKPNAEQIKLVIQEEQAQKGSDSWQLELN